MSETAETKVLTIRKYVEKRIGIIKDEISKFDENNSNQIKEWTSKYQLELFETIQNKFFFKNEDDYYNSYEERISDITDYLEQRISMFTKYRTARKFAIENEDDVEANEMSEESKFVLSKFIRCDYVESSETETEISDIEINSSSVIVKPVLKSPELILKESFDSLPIKEKIEILYNNAKEKGIQQDKEEDGLIYTYITTTFNPAETDLDETNLFLNLSLIDNILTYTNLEWDFETNLQVSQENIYITGDDSKKSTSTFSIANNTATVTSTQDISNKFQDIIDSNTDISTKYAMVSERRLLTMLNTHCLKQLAEHGDSKTVNVEEYKMDKLIADTAIEMDSVSFYVQKMLNITDENASIYITKDLKDKLDISYNPHTNNNNEIVEYLGQWNNRRIYQMNVQNIPKWEKAEQVALIMNNGNKFYINPEKPLVYINVIENPMITKQVIYMFYSMKMEFHQSKASLFSVEHDYFDTF